MSCVLLLSIFLLLTRKKWVSEVGLKLVQIDCVCQRIRLSCCSNGSNISPHREDCCEQFDSTACGESYHISMERHREWSYIAKDCFLSEQVSWTSTWHRASPKEANNGTEGDRGRSLLTIFLSTRRPPPTGSLFVLLAPIFLVMCACFKNNLLSAWIGFWFALSVCINCCVTISEP